MEATEFKQLTEAEKEQYAQRAEEIAKELNLSKVYPAVFINPDTNDRVVCYIKEPNYMMKLVALDKGSSLGLNIAAEELRQNCTLTEHSDAITYGDTPACDPYKLGVCNYIVSNLVSSYVDQYKKK